MRLLALDAALGWCSAALLIDGTIVGECSQEPATGRLHGQSDALPRLVRDLLGRNTQLDAVAATVGPGSFTGLRAALALAHGVALAAGARTIGITVPQAIRQAVNDPACWVVLAASRDRLFLDRDGQIDLIDRSAMPIPPSDIALAGDAATMLECGNPVLKPYQPLARAVALAAAKIAAEKIHLSYTDLQSFMPLYVDAPAVKHGVMRPPPAERD